MKQAENVVRFGHRFSHIDVATLDVAERETLLNLALMLANAMHQPSEKLVSPAATKVFLQNRIGASEREVFGVLWLNSQNQVILAEELFFGSVNSASVYPREVVKAALKNNAANAIFYHCHPSGNVEASQADKTITKTLQDALQVVDVNVLDHFIVSKYNALSFKEACLL